MCFSGPGYSRAIRSVSSALSGQNSAEIKCRALRISVSRRRSYSWRIIWASAAVAHLEVVAIGYLDGVDLLGMALLLDDDGLHCQSSAAYYESRACATMKAAAWSSSFSIWDAPRLLLAATRFRRFVVCREARMWIMDNWDGFSPLSTGRCLCIRSLVRRATRTFALKQNNLWRWSLLIGPIAAMPCRSSSCSSCWIVWMASARIANCEPSF